MSPRKGSVPCLGPGRHFGEFRATAELAGLKLTETIHAANGSLPLHTHERPYVTVVLDGTWEETYGHGSLLCKPLTIIYHPREEVHADSFGGERCRCLRIDLGEEWERRVPRPEEPVNVRGGPASWIGLRLHGELAQDDAFSSLAVEGLMLELLAGLGRARQPAPSGRPPAWLRTVLDRLEAMDDPPQTVNELAELAGVHPVHLARVFRQHHGCTPADYLRGRRLDRACRLLSSTDDPIADVAYQAGFSDQSHLNRTFRNQLGTTPAQFRAGVRG